MLSCVHGQVLPLGASKGDGLGRLLKLLGVDPAAVLACGDGENDVEMLQMVGTSVAMGNAGAPVRSERSSVSIIHSSVPLVSAQSGSRWSSSNCEWGGLYDNV